MSCALEPLVAYGSSSFIAQKPHIHSCTPACPLTFTKNLKSSADAGYRGFFEVAPGHQIQKPIAKVIGFFHGRLIFCGQIERLQYLATMKKAVMFW
jgi:hypothetical protein